MEPPMVLQSVEREQFDFPPLTQKSNAQVFDFGFTSLWHKRFYFKQKRSSHKKFRILSIIKTIKPPKTRKISAKK